ncbi:MAG: hypothetical protein AAGF11_06805 [Myxococcota bacterium]
MASSSREIGLKLHASGQLDRFEKAVESDDSMEVVTILQTIGVGEEIISRMLLQLDKDYLLELIDAGRRAAE